MNPWKITRILGHYRLIERIGRGGMGEVFLAHDSHLDRRVALKCLPEGLTTDSVAREQLRREALAAAALDHPFICKVFEVGEREGTMAGDGERSRQMLGAASRLFDSLGMRWYAQKAAQRMSGLGKSV